MEVSEEELRRLLVAVTSIERVDVHVGNEQWARAQRAFEHAWRHRSGLDALPAPTKQGFLNRLVRYNRCIDEEDPFARGIDEPGSVG